VLPSVFSWSIKWSFYGAGVLTLLLLIMLVMDAFRKDGHVPPPEDPY